MTLRSKTSSCGIFGQTSYYLALTDLNSVNLSQDRNRVSMGSHKRFIATLMSIHVLPLVLLWCHDRVAVAEVP